jgi:hypothetical protein
MAFKHIYIGTCGPYLIDDADSLLTNPDQVAKLEDLSDKITVATVHAADSKTTPIDADELLLVDSTTSYSLKKLIWANLKATLKTYFDGLYITLDTAIKIGASAEAASATNRGTIRYVAGGAGVSDKFEVCVKSAADTYSWETLYTAP